MPEKKFDANVRDFALGEWADAVHTKRWKAKITTRQLGAKMNVSPSMISRWERRLSIPTVPDFLWLCHFFQLNPCDFFQPRIQSDDKSKDAG